MSSRMQWLNAAASAEGPIYLALAWAAEAAIRNGELQPGERLPPQRAIAAQLGIDLTTVTRAFGLLRDRGLVEGTVGRGAFVRARAADDEAGLVDLSMNLPPPPDGVSLGALLTETTGAILQRSDLSTLMAYHEGAGTLGQKASAAQWCAPALGEVPPERMLIAPGAQAALAASLATICKPGDAVVVEPLTYPGLKSLATQLGLRLLPCAVDGEGLRPDVLRNLCRAERPAAIYVVPTLQNPTATTMGAERRMYVAAVAVAEQGWLIEDDPYSRLLEAPPPAVASFAPHRTIHIASLAKTLSPGLRLAFVAGPQALVEPLSEALRAFSQMPSPLMAAVASSWIREGQAETVLAGVRREARARRAMAAEVLPTAVGDEASLHVWLPLASGVDAKQLRQNALQKGLSLVTAETFATGPRYPSGVRISLGAPNKRATVAQALATTAALLRA